MINLYREVIDDSYPVIVHKVIKGKCSYEQLSSERYIIGYVICGEKKIDNTRGLSSGTVYCLPIGNYNITHFGEGDNLEYQEIMLSFDMVSLRDEILSYHTVENDCNVGCSDLKWSFQQSSSAIKSIFRLIAKKSYYHPCQHCLHSLVEKVLVLDLLLTILSEGVSSLSQMIIWALRQGVSVVSGVVERSGVVGLKISQLALMCNMSESQFKREFVSIYHTTPHKWILSRQLNMAAELLENQKLAIKDIAHECGFSNPSHLVKRFKERFGVTPKEYRKTHKNNCL